MRRVSREVGEALSPPPPQLVHTNPTQPNPPQPQQGKERKKAGATPEEGGHLPRFASRSRVTTVPLIFPSFLLPSVMTGTSSRSGFTCRPSWTWATREHRHRYVTRDRRGCVCVSLCRAARTRVLGPGPHASIVAVASRATEAVSRCRASVSAFMDRDRNGRETVVKRPPFGGGFHSFLFARPLPECYDAISLHHHDIPFVPTMAGTISRSRARPRRATQ